MNDQFQPENPDVPVSVIAQLAALKQSSREVRMGDRRAVIQSISRKSRRAAEWLHEHPELYSDALNETVAYIQFTGGKR